MMIISLSRRSTNHVNTTATYDSTTIKEITHHNKAIDIHDDSIAIKMTNSSLNTTDTCDDSITIIEIHSPGLNYRHI